MQIKDMITKRIHQILKPEHDLRYEVICCLVFNILLILSVFAKPVALLCFVVSAGMLLFLRSDAIYRWLLFAFPCAVIFKMDPDSSSFFTYLEFLSLFLIVIRTRKISPLVVAGIALLVLEVLVGINSLGAVVDIVKLVAGLLLYYYFTEEYLRKDIVKYTSFFLAGMISSSILGMFKLNIPRLMDMYYGEVDYARIGGEQITRFQGIFNDPNYFSIAAILCVLICLLALLSRTYAGSKRNLYTWIGVAAGFVLFSLWGLSTISKSFFLLYVVTIVIAVLDLRKSSPLLRKLDMKKALIAAGIAVVAVVVIDPMGLISSVIGRLQASDLLTGRGKIWGMYWTAISQSAGVFLFGNGIDAGLLDQQSAHNMYLETVYYIGLIGCLLYAANIVLITWCKRRPFQHKISNYLGFAAVFATFMFLCGLNRTEYKYYLMIAFMIFNYNFQKQGRKLMPENKE